MTLLPHLMAQDAELAELGKAAVTRGLSAWTQGVVEPGYKAFRDPEFDDDRAFINDLIHSYLGWARCSAKTKDFRWDGDFEWCGAFGVAFCWNTLKPGIRKHYAASTYRLFKYARYQRPPGLLNFLFADAYTQAPTGTVPRKTVELHASDPVIRHQQVAEFGVRPGDILVVGGGDRWGQHITVVRSYDPALRVFSTVEGNATGRGPEQGSKYQGVIVRERGLAEARHLYRPGWADILGNG